MLVEYGCSLMRMDRFSGISSGIHSCLHHSAPIPQYQMDPAYIQSGDITWPKQIQNRVPHLISERLYIQNWIICYIESYYTYLC